MTAEHRVAVLVALAEREGRQVVTADWMAREDRSLSPDGWLGVLRAMARPDVDGHRLLYPVDLALDPHAVEYAVGPAGWLALRRLTAGAVS